MNQTSVFTWVGIVLTALVVLFLVGDASMSLFSPESLRPEMDATGFPPEMTRTLGLVILACAVLYAIPQTALFGAILVTGFLGGAIAMHFRLGEIGSPPQFVCLLVGIATWGGLYFRDARLRALLPFRSAIHTS